MAENIRGIVYSRYKSIRSFAKAIGWDRTKACNIVNGSREPRVTELQELANILQLPVTELADIFLHEKSQNCDGC